MERKQLLELAKKYGSPIYVYDTEKIESQYNRLIDAFSTVKNLKLNYAYNSRYLPAEVMVHQGKDYLIRKRQTIQDILNNQEIITLS